MFDVIYVNIVFSSLKYNDDIGISTAICFQGSAVT